MLREQLQTKQDLIHDIEARIEEMKKELKKLEKSIEGLEEGSSEQNRMMARLLSQSSDIEKVRRSLKVEKHEMEEMKERYAIVNAVLVSFSE
ncbi:hypothetical protein BASA60_005561 [Batrachochytrium salamandrivorans]|nr:hypothetical protein BASA60_005561 [Batrachochytrium salamandrivorans]